MRWSWVALLSAACSGSSAPQVPFALRFSNSVTTRTTNAELPFLHHATIVD